MPGTLTLALVLVTGVAASDNIPASRDEAGICLRRLVDSGALSDLRWPNFLDRQADIRRFYEVRGYRLAWTRDGEPTAQAQAAIQALRNAPAKGLDPEDYNGSRWPAVLTRLRPSRAQPSEEDLARFDLALTVSLMRYASDLHSGKVNPSVFGFSLDTQRKQSDLAALLNGHVVNVPDVQAELDRLEPPFVGYRRAEKALQRYLKLAGEDDGELLPATRKAVQPGDSYPGTARLQRRLRLLGDLPPNAAFPPDTQIYQGALVDAVKHFQRRHGLDASGRIDPATWKQLNTPLSHRVKQLQLVLERWRWAPETFARPPIVVNIPEFRLRAYNDRYEPELEMKVIVGKAYRRQTPVFANQMTHLIFRPYWNVPFSIQRNELAPRIAKDDDYLGKNEYEVVDARRRVVAKDAITPEFLAQLRSGALSVRQIPGAKNALGSVKFMFPNEYNVYLHGTPGKALFAKSRRDFSHGCIRVEKPEELALWVLRGQPGWDLERIRTAETGVWNKQVDLDRPIPVLIVYGTAVVRADGEVYFFDDIYGHDRRLEELLDNGYPYSGWEPTSAAPGPRPRG